jgi:hypothetical protein
VIRRILRLAVWLGVLAGIAYAVARLLEDRGAVQLEEAPATEPPPWVEPDGATCPATHPVKAKLSSRIFHLPGMANYDRTNPDRCYRGAAEAEADGLRQAKR